MKPKKDAIEKKNEMADKNENFSVRRSQTMDLPTYIFNEFENEKSQ